MDICAGYKTEHQKYQHENFRRHLKHLWLNMSWSSYWVELISLTLTSSIDPHCGLCTLGWCGGSGSHAVFINSGLKHHVIIVLYQAVYWWAIIMYTILIPRNTSEAFKILRKVRASLEWYASLVSLCAVVTMSGLTHLIGPHSGHQTQYISSEDSCKWI